MIQDSVGNNVEDELPLEHTLHINDLPSEVLLNIFCNLSPVDLRDCRLVCCQWNDVVLDKAAWTRAFDNRFLTGDIFASVTGSHLWILEYFGRVASLRTWAKAKSVAKLYALVNSGLVNLATADFTHDRLLTFSRTRGSVTICTLSLGKNQVFIPENYLLIRTLAYDINWKYLCVGTSNGEVYLKSLITATSSGSSRLSVSCLAAGIDSIVQVKINQECDKHREKADIIYATEAGRVGFLSLNGKLLFEITFQERVVYLDTNWKKYVVVISSTHITSIGFNTKEVVHNVPHDWNFETLPPVCDIDFASLSVVLGLDDTFKVFGLGSHSLATGQINGGVQIINGTIQETYRERDFSVVGGDGCLYALTLSDGSVAVFELREAKTPISFKTRIMPFYDDRMPQNIHMYTKVALNSSVIAIGALADWVHFYDAHSGYYLREGAKVSRKFTSDELNPIFCIKFAPQGASGVVVSGDVVQCFRYGELPPQTKRSNAPQASDMSTKRIIQQDIKTQLDEYDQLQQDKQHAAVLVDKFNGKSFDDEQEELHVAMALSASTINVEDTELERALALLREDVPHASEHWNDFGSSPEYGPQEGSSNNLEEISVELGAEEFLGSENEVLKRVLQLSMLES